MDATPAQRLSFTGGWDEAYYERSAGERWTRSVVVSLDPNGPGMTITSTGPAAVTITVLETAPASEFYIAPPEGH